MIKITNGLKTFTVTKGAFDGIFSHQGFRICNDEDVKEAEQAPVVDDITDDVKDNDEQVDDINVSAAEDFAEADNAYVEELLEKPLSQWSGDEIKEFVRIKGIDTSGAQKLSQVRGIIKNYLDEQAKNA